MLAAGLGFSLFFWIIFAATGVIFIVAFLVVEESMFIRVAPATASAPAPGTKGDFDPTFDSKMHNGSNEVYETTPVHSGATAPRRTLVQRLLPWDGHTNPLISYWLTILRSFT